MLQSSFAHGSVVVAQSLTPAPAALDHRAASTTLKRAQSLFELHCVSLLPLQMTEVAGQSAMEP